MLGALSMRPIHFRIIRASGLDILMNTIHVILRVSVRISKEDGTTDRSTRACATAVSLQNRVKIGL